MSSPDVALVTPFPPPGSRHEGRSGVASYAANLAEALADAGARVAVVAPEDSGAPRSHDDGRVRVDRPFRAGAAALPAAMRAAADTGAPVVHLQHEFFLYGGPASLASLPVALGRARRGGRRVVVTMHQVVRPRDVDSDFVRVHRVRVPAALPRVAMAGANRALATLADRVVVHEPGFVPVVPGSVLVPHGLEPVEPLDRAEARASLGLDDRLTVLCFGFLAPYKGLEVPLEAARTLGDAVRLVVAGGEHPRLAGRDPYAASLRERYGDVARFTGRVPERDLPAWFSAVDVAPFLYPRPFSSSGGLALALAYGTAVLLSPAIAASFGAPDELRVPADAASLARRLSTLAADPERLRELRARSRGLARGRSWREVAARHLELYEEVTGGPRARAGAVR